MKGALRIFFGAAGTRPSLVLVCLVLAGFAEGIGMSSLLAGDDRADGRSERWLLGAQPLCGRCARGRWHRAVDGKFLPSDHCRACVSKPSCPLSRSPMSDFASAEVSTGLRTELLSHLLRVRWKYFTGQHVGRIANAVSNDATRAGIAYTSSAKFVAYIIQGTVYVVVALLVSWKLALVGLGIGLAMTTSLNELTRISRRAGYKQTDRTSELVTYVSDALNNIKPLRTMARQSAFVGFICPQDQIAQQGAAHQGDCQAGSNQRRGADIYSSPWG